MGESGGGHLTASLCVMLAQVTIIITITIITIITIIITITNIITITIMITRPRPAFDRMGSVLMGKLLDHE